MFKTTMSNSVAAGRKVVSAYRLVNQCMNRLRIVVHRGCVII